MTEEEKNLLLEIDNLYTKLIDEPIMQKPSGFNYCLNAKKLQEKVFELYDKCRPNYLNRIVLGEIAHTCNKEVSYVNYHYNLAMKKNAAGIQNTKFLNSIDTANSQIHLDLLFLFPKIEEAKNLNK